MPSPFNDNNDIRLCGFSLTRMCKYNFNKFLTKAWWRQCHWCRRYISRRWRFDFLRWDHSL